MDHVCAECFEDSGLQDFVKSNAESLQCTFCGGTSPEPISAELRTVTDFFRECIREEYDDAANHLGFESADGGYQGLHWDSYDLVREELEIELPRDQSDELFEALVDSLDDVIWCDANAYGLSSFDLARFSWKEFSRVVKHERRYSFNDHEGIGTDILTPGKLLDRIVEFSELRGGFFELMPETPLLRVRSQSPGNPWTEPSDLGPPPPEKARQSRMSPAGIPMLYVADSLGTAIAEMRGGSGHYSVADLRVTRPALLLDLSDVPPVPSLFSEISDKVDHNPRRVLSFLHSGLSHNIPMSQRLNSR